MEDERMKIILLLGVIGHILCGISDCLLTYAPNGKVNLMDFKEYEKSSVSFRGMSLKNLTLAMVLGVAAMTLELFGYMELCHYVQGYSIVYYRIMYISALIMLISLPMHHIICCLCEWFFVRLGLTKEALDSVWDFFKCTVYTMYVGYLAMLVFAVAFLVVVVTGRTGLPQWAGIFNLLPLFVIVMPTKLPAKANVIGAVMFLGLMLLI
ncbi:DUF6796 family protein [Jutongia sp.]